MNQKTMRIITHTVAAACGAAVAVLAAAGTCALKDKDGTGSDKNIPECVTTGEHVYGNPEWIWQTDNSGAVAEFTCTECGTKDFAVASVEQSLTAAPQCTENQDGTPSTVDGETAYTAVAVFNGAEYSDSKKESVPYELTFGVTDCDRYVDYSLNGIATTSAAASEICAVHTSVGIFTDGGNIGPGTGGSVFYTVNGKVYEETTLAAYIPSDFADIYITFSSDNTGETKQVTYYPINYSLSLIEWSNGAPQPCVIGNGSLKDISESLGHKVFDYSAGDTVNLCFVLTWEWKLDNGYIDYAAEWAADVYTGDLEGALWKSAGSSFQTKGLTASSYKTYYVTEANGDEWGFTFVAERI